MNKEYRHTNYQKTFYLQGSLVIVIFKKKCFWPAQWQWLKLIIVEIMIQL